MLTDHTSRQLQTAWVLLWLRVASISGACRRQGAGQSPISAAEDQSDPRSRVAARPGAATDTADQRAHRGRRSPSRDRGQRRRAHAADARRGGRGRDWLGLVRVSLVARAALPGWRALAVREGCASRSHHGDGHACQVALGLLDRHRAGRRAARPAPRAPRGGVHGPAACAGGAGVLRRRRDLGHDHADRAGARRAYRRRARGDRPRRGGPAAHRHAPAEVPGRWHDPDGTRRAAHRDGRRGSTSSTTASTPCCSATGRSAPRRPTRSGPCCAPATRRSACSTTAAGSTTGSRSACRSSPPQSTKRHRVVVDDLREDHGVLVGGLAARSVPRGGRRPARRSCRRRRWRRHRAAARPGALPVRCGDRSGTRTRPAGRCELRAGGAPPGAAGCGWRPARAPAPTRRRCGRRRSRAGP